MMQFSETQFGSTGRIRFEWPLILLAVTLTIIGITLIYSATVPFGKAGWVFFVKQITWCCLGLALTGIFLLFDYHMLERWGIWFYVAVILALIVVWGVGKVTAGSRRWIDFGLLRFQPSEFAKLAVVIVLAKHFRNNETMENIWGNWISPLLLVGLPAGLILIQPDLGTAGVVLLVAASMIVFAGLDRRVLKWVGGTLLALAPSMWLIFNLLGDHHKKWLLDKILMSYQLQRIRTFMDPSQDPLGSGYHILQSKIAIGSGGVYGTGFLKGTQNQLMFLPVKHTDFIFSILAEEWGFVGSIIVIGLFIALLLRGMGVAGRARDNFGALLAFGSTMVIFWHVVINIGMVMGMVPVVGVPLSFVSYGGSSLLVSYLAIAILANVSMRGSSY